MLSPDQALSTQTWKDLERLDLLADQMNLFPHQAETPLCLPHLPISQKEKLMNLLIITKKTNSVSQRRKKLREKMEEGEFLLIVFLISFYF